MLTANEQLARIQSGRNRLSATVFSGVLVADDPGYDDIEIAINGRAETHFQVIRAPRVVVVEQSNEDLARLIGVLANPKHVVDPGVPTSGCAPLRAVVPQESNRYSTRDESMDPRLYRGKGVARVLVEHDNQEIRKSCLREDRRKRSLEKELFTAWNGGEQRHDVAP